MGDNSRIFIEDIKWGWTNQEEDPYGDTGYRLTSVKIRQNEKSRWFHHLAHDVSMFWLSDDDLHGNLLYDSYIEENMDYVESLEIHEFEGFPLCDDRPWVDALENNQDNPHFAFFRYLIRLYCEVDEKIHSVIALGKGKFEDEIDLPPYDYFSERKMVEFTFGLSIGLEIPNDDELRKRWGLEEKK